MRSAMVAELLKPRELCFDEGNPRLVDDGVDGSQLACAEVLYEDHDPINIGRSLSEFGYFQAEPMIVLREEGRDGPCPVLEGNRRLLAIRLLLDPKLRASLDVLPEWEVLAARAEETGALTAESDIFVLSVKERGDADPQIGFRHIVGIKKWGAFEKAAFLGALVKRLKNSDDPFGSVAQLVSEDRTSIQRSVRDLRALRQMEDAVGRRLPKARDDFGSYTRFMQAGGTRKSVELVSPSDTTAVSEKPMKAELQKVKTLVSLLYGGDGKPAVVTDSRQATELGKVLASPEAREDLLKNRNLERAIVLTDALEKRVYGLVRTALTKLHQALEDVAKLPEGKAKEIQSEVAELAQVVGRVEQTLKTRISDATDDEDAG